LISSCNRHYIFHTTFRFFDQTKMNFSADLSAYINVSTEVLLVCIAKSPMATNAEKAQAAKLDMNVSIPQGLTPIMSRALLRSQVLANTNVTQSSNHASGTMNVVRDTAKVIEIRPDAVRIEDIPEPVPYFQGYFCGDHKKVVRSQVADRIAYAYSPTVETNSSVRESIFSKFNGSFAMPHITTVLAGSEDPVENDRWVKDKAIANSMKVLNDIQSVSGLRTVLAATKPIFEHIEKQINPGQEIFNAHNLPQRFIPKMKICRTEEQAYNLQSIHRSARGEDADASNAMTVGYYLGHMPLAMYTTFWVVSDILYVSRQLKVNTIILDIGMKSSVGLSLVANGYTVIQLSADPSKRTLIVDENNNLKRDIVQVLSAAQASTLGDKSLYVIASRHKASVQFSAKKGVVCPDSITGLVEAVKSVNKAFHVMAWIPICTRAYELASQSDLAIQYSTHAHAGQSVVVRSTDKLPSVDLIRSLDRMTSANIIKTWFPIGRTRFFEIDFKKYQYTHPSCAGLKLQFRVKSRKQAQSVDLVDEEVEASLVTQIGSQQDQRYDEELIEFMDGEDVEEVPAHVPEPVQPPASVATIPHTQVENLEPFGSNMEDDMDEAELFNFKQNTKTAQVASSTLVPESEKADKAAFEAREDQQRKYDQAKIKAMQGPPAVKETGGQAKVDQPQKIPAKQDKSVPPDQPGRGRKGGRGAQARGDNKKT